MRRDNEIESEYLSVQSVCTLGTSTVRKSRVLSVRKANWTTTCRRRSKSGQRQVDVMIMPFIAGGKNNKPAISARPTGRKKDFLEGACKSV